MMEEASFAAFIELVVKFEKAGYRPVTQWCPDVQQIVTDWVHPKGFASNVAARIYLSAKGTEYCVASIFEINRFLVLNESA